MVHVVHHGSSPGDAPPPLPAWAAGPPENELPVPVAVHAVLARTDDLVIALVGGHVWSTGVSLDLTVRVRRRDPAAPELFLLLDGLGRGRRTGPLPGRLLLGVELADGRVATNLQREHADDDAPRLVERGGHGGERTVDKQLWLTPVPPEGDLVVVCACEALGVAETRTVVPAAVLTGARERVVRLWDVEPDVPGADAPLADDVPAGGWFERAARAPGSDG